MWMNANTKLFIPCVNILRFFQEERANFQEMETSPAPETKAERQTKLTEIDVMI